MSKKNKVMLALAIGAILILIGSGVARCTLQQDQSPASEGSVTTEIAPASQEGQASSRESSMGSLESLIGTTWVAEDDPAATLSIVRGAFIESVGDASSVTYWTLEDEATEGNVVSARISAAKSMTDAQALSLVSVTTKEDGSHALACDALAHVYVMAKTEVRQIQFANVTDKLAESMGAEASKIEAAVSARAATISPSAKTASWDAEVWCDFAANTATTTFTLDDGAASIVSVTRTADGTIEAI